MGFQNTVVKDHINEIELVTDKDTLLSGFKTETISKFDNKIPQMVK